MLIHSFDESDRARLTELAIETFRPIFEDVYPALLGEVIFANQWSNWREDYHTEVAGLHDPEAHKFVAVAEVDGAIAGCIGWRVDPDTKYACIELIAVDPGRRRSGVGAALCEHAFAQMRALGAEMVEIRTGADDFHAPARALYESLGCIQYPTAAYYREL
jgi:ribosomal protein S18 acetylase RimI-like enzyme